MKISAKTIKLNGISSVWSQYLMLPAQPAAGIVAVVATPLLIFSAHNLR